MHQVAEGAPLSQSCAALAVVHSVQNKPCFDLCGRRSRVRRRLHTAPGTTSARRGVVWVYVVVTHPGEVLPACGKVPRGAVTGVGRTPFPTQPPRPYHFVWLTTGRTVRIECLVHLSTNLTEGRLRFLLGGQFPRNEVENIPTLDPETPIRDKSIPHFSKIDHLLIYSE